MVMRVDITLFSITPAEAEGPGEAKATTPCLWSESKAAAHSVCNTHGLVCLLNQGVIRHQGAVQQLRTPEWIVI